MRGMCGVQLNVSKGSEDLMFGLNETMDRSCMANNVRWHCHLLRREDGHVLRRALDFEVDGQRKKGRLKRRWNCRLRKKV